MAGRGIDKRRNRLTGAHAEDLIFLHETWDAIFPYDDDVDDDIYLGHNLGDIAYDSDVDGE